MNFLIPDVHVPLTVTLTSISRQSHPLLFEVLQAAIEDTGATIETPCLFPPLTEHQAAEIESLELDEGMLKSREAWRQSFYDRLFYLAAQRRAELEQRQTRASFDQTIDEIARGD